MDDLRRLFRRAVLSATLNEGVPGLLGRHDGTLAYTDAQGRTHRDRCWARIGNGDATTEIVVRSSGVPRQYNLPVIIANRGGVPTAIHVDHQRAAQFSAGYLAEVPSHAWTHSRYGLDPLYVPGQQVLQLMAYPTSSASMAVTVAQGFYRWEGVSKVWEVGNSPDLSAFVPTDPSTQHFIVLCLDRANNALAVVDGTDAVAEPTAIPFDAGDVAALSIPLAYYPICAIRFYTGQTSILPYDIFMDLRLWGGEDLGGEGWGGVMDDGIWEAKGDLAVATGPGAATRLPVGTDGQALIADSSQATGLAWGNVAALTVEEADSVPSVDNVDTIIVPNGTLTDNGDGSVRLDFGSAATDGSAIHDNVPGEIAAISEKVSPISTDLLLIEDSEAANAKKRVQVGNLPGGAGHFYINFVIDGGGESISTGEKGVLRCPAGTIVEASLVADQDGDIVVDIWKGAYTDLPLNSGGSICATNKLQLDAAQKVTDTTLTGWTVSLAEGDWLAFNVDTAATVEQVTVSLKVSR